MPRETIRREGERQHYSGAALDDFEEIVALIDDAAIEIEMKRLADEAKKNARKKPGTRS